MVHDSAQSADRRFGSNALSDAAASVASSWHPLLFGAYPVLRLYAENLAVIPLANLWAPLAATLGVTLCIWLVAALVCWSIERGARVASVLVAMLFVYEPIARVLSSYGAWAVYVLVAVLAGWKWKRTGSRFFNLTGLVLASMLVAQIGYRLYHVATALSSAPGSTTAAVGRDKPKPDIFYIILDGYGRSDSVKAYIGYDNSAFISGLKRRGFYVADKAHSNYSQTEQSLSSSLNMDYLSELLPEGTDNDVARRKFDDLIDNNRVAGYLRSIGYRYVAVTTGFEAVSGRSADVRYDNNSALTLFETTLLNATPFASTQLISGSQYVRRYERLQGAFKDLKGLAARGPLPRFVFVHILAPHPPFVINGDGTMRKHSRMPYGLWDGDAYLRVGGTVESYREGYAGQAEYVGRQILEACDAIQKDLVSPVIIVQGDHGSKTRLDDQSLQKTDVREVFRNLNAYYVPAALQPRLRPDLTPVNSFRMLLNGLFDAPYKQLPDRSYYSTWDEPFKFAEVTNEIEKPLPTQIPPTR